MLRRAWRSAALGACASACTAGVEAAHMYYSGQHLVALLMIDNCSAWAPTSELSCCILVDNKEPVTENMLILVQ